MNTLEQIYEKSGNDREFFRQYCQYLSRLLMEIDAHKVYEVMQCFLKARENNKVIYFAGNGGSAATASHFAQDIAEIGRKIDDKGFRAQSITDNVSAITAIANDYDYDSIFARQIQYVFNPGDVLVVISASGNSQNVINAVNLAKEKKGITIALVGFDGGQLAKICDHVIHIKSLKGEYGPVEDVHVVINHMITSYLIMSLKKKCLR